MKIPKVKRPSKEVLAKVHSFFRKKLDDFVPFVKASVEKRMLVITETGNLSMTVETGFSGGIALPLKLIKRIGLKPVVYDRFR